MSLFGAPKTPILFGNQTNNQGNSLFGNNNNNTNNNNKTGLFSNTNAGQTNLSFGTGTGTNTLFSNNNNAPAANQSLFGTKNNGGNNQNSFLGNNTQNQSQSIFGQNNAPSLFNNNNNPFQQQQKNNTANTNIIFNNNPPSQGNKFNNQNQNINWNNSRLSHDLYEYKQLLINVKNCTDPSLPENMFKDYLYMPIPKGRQPNEFNIYRPYTYINQQQKIMNDYKIWDEANKNNKDPNKFFPIQISTVDALLNRYKNLEKGILMNITKNLETQKNLENLNKKIDDEMSSKLNEIKACHTRLDKLQLDLSSKVAQYNYLLGTARENILDTHKIKENIKKAEDNINKNNIVDLSEKAKKMSNEQFEGENKDYLKEMNKDKVNKMLDALTEIQGMMNVVNNNNKKNLNIVKGMQKEVDRILKKNEMY